MNEQQQPGRTTPCLEAGQLMAWLDGALPAPEAAAVQAHLAICPRCAAQERALVSDCQQVFGLLTSLDPPTAAQAGPDLALARFQQRLHAQHTGTFVHDSNGTIHPGTFPLSGSEREETTLPPARPSRHRHRPGAVAQTLVAAILVAAFLGTILLLRGRAPTAGDYNHSPSLMLSPTVTFIGSTIQLALTNFPPSTSVVLTHDVGEPLHLANGSSIITVGPAGSASVEIHIDSSWGTGSHVIVAKDLKTNATVSATLQIASSAKQAYALFVATNGIMDGFDAQHTHFNPFEQVLSPTTVGGLTQKWSSFNMESGIVSSPTVAGGVVYIGCCGYVYAFDAVTRKKKWAYPTEGSRQVVGEPAVVGGVVYIGTIESHTLYALDAATGKKKWAYQTGGRIGSSPTVVGGVVYVGSFDHTLYALDAATGAKKWAYQTGDLIETSPAVAGGVVYVGSRDGYVYALDAATGAKKWMSPEKMSTDPVVAGGLLYFGTEDGYVCALDVTTGVVKWFYWDRSTVSSSPAVADGMVYYGSMNGFLYAFHLRGT